MPTPDDALEALQFLAAMYPLDGELVLSPSAAASLESGTVTPPLDAVLNLALEGERHIALSISLLPLRISPRQPPFLTRSAHETLSAGVAALPHSPDLSESLIAAIEYVRATAPLLAVEEEVETQEEEEDDGPLERVWFWLPSLNTKEKRRDMVDYAPRFRLAGFVLAGKPALLCLEGGGHAVDRYMAAIKSQSWGDVPSFQKKVGECDTN